MDINSTKYKVESSPAIRSDTASYDENYILSKSGILNIYGNCTKDEVGKIIREKTQRGIILIQFGQKFSVEPKLLNLLNTNILEEFPECRLRTNLNGYGAFEDLEFLKYLKNLKSLSVELFGESDLSPINKYCKLKDLGIGGDNLRIKEITDNKSIENLSVFRKIKDIESIRKMSNLKRLTIIGMTLKNLDFLKELINLKELDFKFGGTKNMEVLSQVGKVESLSFTRVRLLKIENLKPINQMKFLKKIRFDTQVHLTNLNWLTNKEIEVQVENCRNFKGEIINKNDNPNQLLLF